MKSIRILEPGPLATVQDQGRFGFRGMGVPLSGAMDLQALRIGNLLVGNDDARAGVEITMGGFRAEFRCDAGFALSGATPGAYLNGNPVIYWRPYQAKQGDLLTIEPVAPAGGLSSEREFRGVRVYLAVSGGIDLPPVMGSRSTYLRGGFGGLEGRCLRGGDTLPLGHPIGKAGDAPAPVGLIPCYSSHPVLRVIPGPQDELVTDEGKSTFFSKSYEVTHRADRMGIALAGPSLELVGGADIISDGTCPGAVQVLGNFEPTILVSDCQTTGGYVKIATIISVDLPLVAQLAPGDRVAFEEISLWEARRMYLRNEYLIRRLSS